MKKLIIAAALLAITLTGCGKNAPESCDPNSDYVCKPNTLTGTTSVEVPTTTLSPTVTTTVVP